MEIQSTRIIEGPNIYSFKSVLLVRLDISGYQERPTNQLPGFNSRLITVLPGLKEHCCSRGFPGGFVERLDEGTYLAHVFEHVLLELQSLAGYPVRFGKTRFSGTEGVYNVVVSYRQPDAAKAACRWALEVVRSAVFGGSVDNMQAMLSDIKAQGETGALGPSTQAIYDAACARGIPVRKVDNENLLILGHGICQQRVWATVTGRTSLLSSDIACDKHITKKLLADNGIPVPYGQVVNNEDEAVEACKRLGSLAAIKPLCGNQGKGVSLQVSSAAEARRSYQIAAEFDNHVIVEEHIEGRQYRLCMVNGEVVAAAERIPAYVLGDGQHTIKDLVNIVNSDPLRGDGHAKPLSKLMIDSLTISVLQKQGLTPASLLPAGKVAYLREGANLSTGGTAVDVTDIVHADNIRLTKRAVRLVGLDVAGVDIVAKDISKPLEITGGAIIEINTAPGIRMHHYPAAGKSRDVAGHIVDYLFAGKSQGRIPIIAITGTNGKTTVSRMISHIWQLAGSVTGMTTTEGIFINGECIMTGDTTGPASARIVLTDPAVEVAVLETARGGILRGGLAFDHSDVGIITNITEDHLGQDGIEDLEDMAHIKSLVLETVRPGGFALINADDPLVKNLAARVKAQIIYFSTESDNPIVRRHLGTGGKAFFVKNNKICCATGAAIKPIVKVMDVPMTFGGIAGHNIQNAVIAAAACECQNVPLTYIRRGLKSFNSNPGRLNIIDKGRFRVCVDYGHNPAGYVAMVKTVGQMRAKRVVGVIAAPGDRRDDVIINIGRIAGQGFQKIYIKEDVDLRGRQPGVVASLLRQGALEAGMTDQQIKTVLAEEEAVKAALDEAKNRELVVIFYEQYHKVMEAITCYHDACQSEPLDLLVHSVEVGKNL